MRIAVLAPLVTPIAEPHIGGSQALLSDLAVGLAGLGHAVRVYAATGSHIDGVDVVDTGVDAASLRATLFRADGAHADSSCTAATEAFGAAAGMIAGDAPDVVHAHAFDAPSVEAVASLGIPWIQVLHLPPDSAVAGAVGRALAGGGPLAVVTVSEAMRSAWAAAGVGARVIRPGVPIERIPWRAGSSRGVLFAGRLSPEKGALDAIAIATDAGMPLTIVGYPYDDEHAAEVRRQAAEAGAAVLLPVPRERLWHHMGGAAAVLCPVRWDEPFGLVAAEAQSTGTPVVGYRRGALPEVVSDGVSGVLVEPGDGRAAALALRDAVRLDRAAIRRHAEERLGLGPAVAAYEAVSLELTRPSAARTLAR